MILLNECIFYKNNPENWFVYKPLKHVHIYTWISIYQKTEKINKLFM